VRYRKIPAAEIADLYNKLEKEIVPMFYKDSNRYIDIMRMSIALNGSFFNTQRMVQQYVTNAYLMRSDALPSVPRMPIKAGV
jgi:starch phosphorylase